MYFPKMDSTISYGNGLRNVVFYCPSSIICLISEQGSNFLTCPLYGGRGKCQVWHLREELESEASIFWDYIKEIFAMITKEDLVYPERMELAQEQRHFLSLSLLGIGKYFAMNGFRFPKSWGTVARILMNAQKENSEVFFQTALKDLWQDSQLLKLLFNDFKNTLLSEKSQRGIILLLYALKKAIDESSELIPEEEPEKIIDDLTAYLKSHLPR